MTEEEAECEQLHNSVHTQYCHFLAELNTQAVGSMRVKCKKIKTDTCRQVERTAGLMGMITDDWETWLNCFSVEIRSACCFSRGLKREASTDL